MSNYMNSSSYLRSENSLASQLSLTALALLIWATVIFGGVAVN
jgi:hypothetical protein